MCAYPRAVSASTLAGQVAVAVKVHVHDDEHH
jgi:hypothetical protein